MSGEKAEKEVGGGLKMSENNSLLLEREEGTCQEEAVTKNQNKISAVTESGILNKIWCGYCVY
jgi:hypothetical protein